MVTKYQRPSGVYTGDATLAHREKYQKDSNQEPKVAISSAKIDSDFNYLIDAINETNTTIVDISAGQLLDYAVSTDKLNAKAVTTEKLADDAVTALNLADDSVDTNALQDSSVTGAKLASNSVVNDSIVDDAISLSKMRNSSVSSSQIINGNILANHLASASVTGAKIATNAITASKINTGAITAAKLEASGVSAGTYNVATITVDAKGRVTSAESGEAVDPQQICKAWVNFNGSNGTIYDDYNVSSVTDHGSGYHQVNLLTSRPSSNYAVAATCSQSNTSTGRELSVSVINKVASSFRVSCTRGLNQTNEREDPAEVSAIIFGD